MKKIITLSLVAAFSIAILAGCTRVDAYNDKSYWFNQERATVVSSSDYCDYFLVDLGDTYAIMQSLDAKQYWPYPNDYMYGKFNSTGATLQYYNQNPKSDYVMRARIVEFNKSKADASNALKSYYCSGVFKAGTDVPRISRDQSNATVK